MNPVHTKPSLPTAPSFGQMQLDTDGIYSYEFSNVEQKIELEMRERVAACSHDQLLKKIALHHSIPVMDHEVAKFLRQIPSMGRVIDVGGGWGWHWRKLQHTRPDVQVFIVDFVRANLLRAKALLGEIVNRAIFLIHGDATDLKCRDDYFDGYWSVQTLQHVVSFKTAVNEARRVLKQGGVFADYSLNDGAVIRWLTELLGRRYVAKGWVEGNYWLERASNERKQIIESIFRTNVAERWTEILYKPELRIFLPGREDAWLGHIDALLSNDTGLLKFIARQHSYHCCKA